MSEREPGPQPDEPTVKVTVRSLKNLGDECDRLKTKLSEARNENKKLKDRINAYEALGIKVSVNGVVWSDHATTSMLCEETKRLVGKPCPTCADLRHKLLCCQEQRNMLRKALARRIRETNK